MGICSSTNKKQQTSKIYDIQNFKFEYLLGKGGFGEVWKVQQKNTQKRYAVKILDKGQMISKKSVKLSLNQRMIMTQFLKTQSKGIINMECAFQDKRRLYILMEFIEGKTLRELFKSQYIFQENQKKFIVFSLVKILQTLFENNIIHHDFKPQNIIFDNKGYPKLIDFGLSAFCLQDNSYHSGGTLEYQAPQILSAFNHTYTADYYSLGVIAYQLFFKKRPYSCFNAQSMMEMIKKRPFNQENFPEIKELNPLAKDFLLRLLQRSQVKRLGFNGIHQILQHSWIKDTTQSMLNSFISKTYIQSTKVSRQDLTSSSRSNEPLSLPDQHNLLEESYVQQMFKDFDYVPSSTKSNQSIAQ